jgi:hypothetical protein
MKALMGSVGVVGETLEMFMEDRTGGPWVIM